MNMDQLLDHLQHRTLPKRAQTCSPESELAPTKSAPPCRSQRKTLHTPCRVAAEPRDYLQLLSLERRTSEEAKSNSLAQLEAEKDGGRSVSERMMSEEGSLGAIFA
jgi:hypothetical protein